MPDESRPKAFSAFTLEKFEEASAGVPLRPLDRAFEKAKIALGDDPGGPAGSRRAQFRRYVATVDQSDPAARDRLGDALGHIVAEVATSKQDFLIQTAERDGFFFAGGVFRETDPSADAFALASSDDLSSIEERGRRLHVLAGRQPDAAAEGAIALVDSVCRAVLERAAASSRRTAAPQPKARAKTPPDGAARADVAAAALHALGLTPAARKPFLAAIAALERLPRDSTESARLIAGIAVAFASFIAAERTA